MLNFPPEVVICWTLKMSFGKYSKYSVKIMGLISFLVFPALLHCSASNLVFEILKHNKSEGTICISVPTPISGGLVPCLLVIYVHVCIDL